MDDLPKTIEQSTTDINETLNQNGTGLQKNLVPQKNNDATAGSRPKPYRLYLRAYGASLCALVMIIPVIASLITAGVYMALPGANTGLYALLAGGLIAVILWLVIAIPFIGFCTAQGANPHTYSLLKIRLHQLKMNLGLKDYADDTYEEINDSNDINTVMKHAGFYNKTNEYQQEVVKEAYACCTELCRKLYYSSTGLQWYSGSGYTSAWRVLHHAEEVMIEVTDDGTVVREAKNDFRSIQGSKVNGKDKLLNDILQAVEVLKPEALPYFKECPPDTNNGVGDQNIQQVKGSNASSSATIESDNNGIDLLSKKETAKLTLREVRRALNEFRDNRWEGLMRQRNRLFKTIAVTGIVTYVLLCVIILAFNSIDIKTELGAAIIIYMVGAIAGLFVRFYAESHSDKSIDDFGLSTTRLIAIPLLSGLAGIGGVLISEILASLASNTQVPNLFTLQPRALLIAAVFGATPNLFIKSLQNQAHEYEADLQSSKAAEKTVDDS